MKISKKVPVKPNFLPVKKTEKMPKTGRERKKLGVKKVKKAPKSGREKSKVPVKKSEKWPKKAFTPTFGFHAKKKTLTSCMENEKTNTEKRNLSPMKKEDMHATIIALQCWWRSLTADLL